MRVVIAGGHGKIARKLGALLSARDDPAVGLIRNPEHADELQADGQIIPATVDLEQAGVAEVAALLAGADAVVFAAGAGPGSGVARKDTVDRAASVLLADAAEQAGVRRFLQVSAMGLDRADDPETGDPRPSPTTALNGPSAVFRAYLRAKAAAERDLAARDSLDWTIIRPGALTDDPPTGRVTLAESVGRAEVSRSDVAAVLLALLDEPRTAGRTLELVGGDTPVADAVAALR